MQAPDAALPQKKDAQPCSLKRVLFWCFVLILLDAFLLNQGAGALLTALWLIFITLPRSLFVKRFAATRGARLRNIALGLAAAASVLALNRVQNELARERAEKVVAAVEAFNAAEKRYPDKLEDLVPRYLPEIPVAKYTLPFHTFQYRVYSGRQSLIYTTMPPFGRRIYSFKEKRWNNID